MLKNRIVIFVDSPALDETISHMKSEEIRRPYLSPSFLKSLCRSQLLHESVNLSFTLTNMKNKLTDSCGNWLLQNDFENTLSEMRPWWGAWLLLWRQTRRARLWGGVLGRSPRLRKTPGWAAQPVCSFAGQRIYLIESVYKVVLQKSTPPKTRQLVLY